MIVKKKSNKLKQFNNYFINEYQLKNVWKQIQENNIIF